MNSNTRSVPKFIKLEGKTIVSPKCSSCLENEHDYCAKRCGCDCWHQD